MMEDAINNVINEPTRCLCNQMVPFVLHSHVSQQTVGSENSGDSTGAGTSPPEPLLINHTAIFVR